MKVAIITDSANTGYYLKKLQAFAQGITNDEVVQRKSYQPIDYDAAVIFGSYKIDRKRPQHRGKGVIINSGIPYVQLETQLIGRSITTHEHDEFRVGVNGFLWDDADWGFDYVDPTRYQKVFERNKYDVNQKWKDNGDHIELCMQKVGDASLRGLDIFDWTRDTIKELRQHTDRKIIVRPHPLYRKKLNHKALEEECAELKDVIWKGTNLDTGEYEPIQNDIANAWCTVTYTSGTGIDAVLSGTPNIACDSGSMVYEVSSKKLSEVENPYRGDRTAWMKKIAMCQWNTEEFENGECWKHIRKAINETSK